MKITITAKVECYKNKDAAVTVGIDDNDYIEMNGKEFFRNAEARVILNPWSFYIFYR